MKHFKLFLVLPLILAGNSCGNEKPTIDKLLDQLLDNVNVKVLGSEKIRYDEDYKYLDETTIISLDRDYSKIKEEGKKDVPAVRQDLYGISTVFVKNEDGGTGIEVLNSDNTVSVKEYRINHNKVLYNEYFGNPFEYISESDIDEEYNLSTLKANLIIETYTGYTVSVKSAKLLVEDNKVTGLDLEIHDRIDGIESTDGYVHSTISYDFDITFSYDVAPITHLAPRTGADESITSALTNKSNYTMTFTSDASTQQSTVYVTEEAIYIHHSINKIGAVDGDIYYKKTDANTYEKFVYKASSGKFNLEELNVEISAILPDYSKINPNIAVKQSTNNYYIDNCAAINTLDDLILPYYDMTDGFGAFGFITTKDGNLSTINATFGDYTRFTITQSYGNYGTTTMPSWLDTSIIR